MADPPAKLHIKTFGETISDMEGKALHAKLADTLVEVKSRSIWKNGGMYRPKQKSTRRLTH